jgi:hypothetical protein
MRADNGMTSLGRQDLSASTHPGPEGVFHSIPNNNLLFYLNSGQFGEQNEPWIRKFGEVVEE